MDPPEAIQKEYKNSGGEPKRCQAPLSTARKEVPELDPSPFPPLRGVVMLRSPPGSVSQDRPTLDNVVVDCPHGQTSDNTVTTSNTKKNKEEIS